MLLPMNLCKHHVTSPSPKWSLQRSNLHLAVLVMKIGKILPAFVPTIATLDQKWKLRRHKEKIFQAWTLALVLRVYKSCLLMQLYWGAPGVAAGYISGRSGTLYRGCGLRLQELSNLFRDTVFSV